VDVLNHQYIDKAWMKVWAFGTLINYPATVRSWNRSSHTYSSSRVVSQPVPWDYRQKIRLHQNATTNLSGSEYREVVDGGSGICLIDYQAQDTISGNPWKDMYWHLRGRIVPHSMVPPEPSWFPTNADLQARLKVLKTIRKEYEAFQGLTFLGELRETINMLRRPLGAIRNGMSDYLRTVKKRASKTRINRLNDMVGGTWLEYVFGWTPLLNDIKSGEEALNEILERYEDSYKRFGAQYETTQLPSSWTYPSTLQNGPWTIKFRYRTNTKGFVRYYGQVFREALVNQGFASRHLGFTLSGFIPTVWELIPYSFLADYFTNTGNLIEAATTNTSGVKWISRVHVSTHYVEYQISEVTRNVSQQPDARTRNVRIVTDFAPSTLERRNVKRVWLSEPPHVSLNDFQWKIPGAGSLKWANMAALAAQQGSVQRFLQKLMS
jgi:hypothetical protein